MRLLACLGVGKAWHGVLSLDGKDADVCPNGLGLELPAPWLQAPQASPSFAP